MNTQLKTHQTPHLESKIEVGEQNEYFNFELWASEVRRQMIESLQKKGIQRETKNQQKKRK
ncbi:MAG: hypothetical protein ABI417_18780 [Coleofasciculaceae cyanobacterium]